MFDIEADNVINFICFLTLLITVFLLIVFIAVKYAIRRQVIHEKRIKDLLLSHENNLLKSQLQVQEQTFQNISREIHDNVGQRLTLAKLRLNTFDTSSFPAINAEITEIVQMLTQSIDDLRDISRSMNSDLIANNGFVKTLENEISQLNRIFEYNFKLAVTGDVIFLDAQKELILFRIAQEAMNNIIKHAEATQIFVDIHYTKTQLEIKVADNGKGFDLDNTIDSNGLNNIKTRAKMLSGNAEFETVAGKGTTVIIKIPIHDES